MSEELQDKKKQDVGHHNFEVAGEEIIFGAKERIGNKQSAQKNKDLCPEPTSIAPQIVIESEQC